MGDLTANFSRREFACRCWCGFDQVSMALVLSLQELRDAIGKPVVIMSGCRCARHNAAVGGAKRSQHVQGLAADIKVAGMSARELYAAARKHGAFRGFGVDDARGFVHLDMRDIPAGEIARWCYRNGHETAWREVAA